MLLPKVGPARKGGALSYHNSKRGENGAADVDEESSGPGDGGNGTSAAHFAASSFWSGGTWPVE